MSRLLALLFTLCFLPRLSAQAARIDSLRAAIASAPDRSTRARLEFQLGKIMHQADSIRAYGQKLLKESQAYNDPLCAGYGERLLGDACFYRLSYKEAVEHYDRADSAFQKAGERSERLTVLSNSGYALLLLGHYGDAIIRSSAQHDLAASLGDMDGVGQASRNIGDCMLKLKRYREAIPYFQKSLQWEKSNDPQDMACLQLACAYEGLQQNDSALYYFQKGLLIAEQKGISFRISTLRQHLGMFYLDQGDLNKAEVHLKAALAILDGKYDKLSAPGIYKSLSDLELRRNNLREAIEWGEKCLDVMGDNRQAMYWGAVHGNLYRAYAALGQTDRALEHALAWKEASDSLAAADNARKIMEVETRYKTREQETVIARQELELSRQRNLLLAGALAFLLVAILAYWAWSRAGTRRKEAAYARELHEAESRRLRELDSVKSAFFANISHEFRTPLALLVGPLKEMENGTFQGNARKYYGIMRRNAERLLQLVNQLLDLSRLENGRLQLDFQPGNLTAALRAMAGSFESLADRKLIHFDVFVPKAPVWVLFDRDKLEKIVTNLLGNAFKFTPEEGTVGLSLKAEPQGADRLLCQLEVYDSGIGIPADQLPHIFERFYQADNNNADNPEGSGIGLALTREIVQLHGGSIKVESLEKRGTRFVILLTFQTCQPIASEPDGTTHPEPAAPETGQETAAEPLPAGAPSRATVLVAEDNPDLLDFILVELQTRFRVLSAANGREALDIATRETPDLVLTDLMMPELDGMALTSKLKQDPRTSHIPVIMLTAKAAREERIEGLVAGAEAYLTKPFDADELRALITRLTDQRRILQEKYSRLITLGAAPLQPALSLEEQFLQQVLQVIEENLDDDMFGVEQLASGVNMSRSNLFRKLDALTGKSPTQLIRELRLERARQLIEQGAGNTTEVALLVGFNTPAYFVKCFVDQYGITPGELRKRHR
ncbi:MAG: response regulator [Saprospiraceae bacterium]